MASYDYDKLLHTVDSLEKEYGIPTGMYRDLIMKGERSGPQSVSPKGAVGLAQLMPGTAKDMGVTDIWDVDQNLRGGAKYFKTQYDDFKDWRLAGAAYNAGPRRVKEAGGVPDIPETRDYLGRVFGPMANGAAPGMGMATDPKLDAQMNEAAVAAQAHATKVSQDVERQIAEHGKRIEEISAAPQEPRPLPPTMRDLPMPPDYNKMARDPTKVLGETLPALAVLGSMFTRHSATNALKAAAAAMKASQTQDKDAMMRAHDTWKDEMESLINQNKLETDRYVNVLEDRRMSLQEKQAELSTLAALDNNAQLKAMIANGQFDQVWKFLQARDDRVYKAAQVYDMSKRREQDQERIGIEKQKVEDLKIYRGRMSEAAAARSTKESLSQYVSRLREEKRAGHAADGHAWGDADEEALTMAEADIQKMNYGPGSSDAPSPAPLAMPSSEAELQDGKVYNTGQGPATWDAKAKTFKKVK